MTGFAVNGTGIVLNMTAFFLNITKCVKKKTMDLW